MTIRTNYKGDSSLHRKIDQLYELAALARQDGDKEDERRHLKKIKELESQLEGDE